VSDVRMEEGSLRCDANVSVRRRGQQDLGTKVEIKNLNSIRSLYRALLFEEERQRKALSEGAVLVQETRHWDENRGVTAPGRSKEYASDYRYFPEPDLTPLEPDPEWVEKLRAELPELPSERRRRLEHEYGLDRRQSSLVGHSSRWAEFFEMVVSAGADPRAAANWITGDLAGLLNVARQDISASRVGPGHIAEIVRMLKDGDISSAGAKIALEEAFSSGSSIQEIVEARGLRQVSDAGALEAVVAEVIEENPGPAEQFKKGKEGALNALVGQVMKKTNGSANPKLAADLLRQRLSG
jgi:aspartyl-tRNA(Asn)/glutamyl-tRNA(Gln) amidotransferase subunit B